MHLQSKEELKTHTHTRTLRLFALLHLHLLHVLGKLHMNISFTIVADCHLATDCVMR